MIIVVANSKGGVGKSTLSVHLAAWLYEQGHRVTLADCDIQHSSSEWMQEVEPEMRTVRLESADLYSSYYSHFNDAYNTGDPQ